MTPEEKYQNDIAYHKCVDQIEHLIHEAHFTPSEIREMSLLACIHFEQKTIRPIFIDKEGNIRTPIKLDEPIAELDKIINTINKKGLT